MAYLNKYHVVYLLFSQYPHMDGGWRHRVLYETKHRSTSEAAGPG